MGNNQNIQTLKGFRDYLPGEKRKRDFIAQKIVEVFKNYGFVPLETPALEYASLLLGKYGEEADKLVYRFEDRGGREVALRYDQTVPTARVLAQYQYELPKYFRRYQIQSVYRADKPQKGRFREFTQCDIDIFGSTSPLADAEILACTYATFKSIGFSQVVLKMNDRQVLFATLKPYISDRVSLTSITQTLDKLGKNSKESVLDELVTKGLDREVASKILEDVKQVQISQNLQEIISKAVALGVPEESLRFTPELARGLDYYTGMIFEVIIPEYGSGSLGGGGRYDNLIKQLSGVDVSAVGVGLGFDRIVEAADEMGLIDVVKSGAKVLVTLFNQECEKPALNVARKLREAGIGTEVYPAFDKLGQQFKLANQKNIPFVIVIGEEEVNQGKIALKNMENGAQEMMDIETAVNRLK
ncbi:MAG: histidine--tRNA ligase [Patescibacteria group bacterium]